MDFECWQEETAQTIGKVAADLELLTKQLNRHKPASRSEVQGLQEKLSAQVTEKLAESDKRVDTLSATLEGQQKTISDNSDLLKDLLIGIENLGENL